jgi:hypothetical protein
VDIEAGLGGEAVEGDVDEPLAVRGVGVLDEVEADAVVGPGGESTEGVVEVVAVAESFVGLFGDRVGDGGAIDGLAEGGRPVAGVGLVVSEIGSVWSRRVGSDRALIDEGDGIVVGGVAVADLPAVAAEGDPGSDGDGLGGGLAGVVGAPGREAVSRTRAEDELAGAGDRLGATL